MLVRNGPRAPQPYGRLTARWTRLCSFPVGAILTKCLQLKKVPAPHFRLWLDTRMNTGINDAGAGLGCLARIGTVTANCYTGHWRVSGPLLFFASDMGLLRPVGA